MVTKEEFLTAKEEDADAVLSFYRSFIGTEGCTWNEYYPTMEHVQMDIESSNLFIVSDEKGIAAVISIDSDPLVDELANWTIENSREAARLAVRKDLQNKGLARQMLTFLMGTLKERGYQGIRFLVSPQNPAALASYAHLQFEHRGEANLYERDWYCYEKRI